MKKFLLISTLMVYTMSVFSATREIKGLVTSDEDNMPLIGASVFVSTDDLKKINYPKESIGVMTAALLSMSPIILPAFSAVIWDTIKKRSNSEKKHFTTSN